MWMSTTLNKPILTYPLYQTVHPPTPYTYKSRTVLLQYTSISIDFTIFTIHYIGKQNEINYVVYCFSSVINKPAIAALVRVLMAPVNMALTATRETSPAREGAN